MKKSQRLVKREVLEHGKLPPQAVDLEEAVIGAILLEKQAMFCVRKILSVECFYKDKHQKIYQACLDLDNDSDPIDILTITNRLKKKGELELVGGAYLLSQLTNRVASTANIEYHAMIVLEKYTKRKQISLGSDIITQAYDETIDVLSTNELISTIGSELLNMIEPNEEKSISDLIRLATTEIEKAEKNEGISGIQTGFKELDDTTGGWQDTDLIVIAARPSMGKTSYVLTMARNIAVDFEKHVAFFSLEMSDIDLVIRLISAETQIHHKKLKKGNLSNEDWIAYNKKISPLISEKLHIFDHIMTIQGIKSKCLQLHLEGKLDIIMIDYMQLIEYPGFKGNREGEVSKISRTLKLLAKELKVPVIVLSQLSRGVESRSTKKPQLSDLRDSGAIEQDADVVQFLFRPDYYELPNSPKGLALGLIKKNRNGELKNIKMKFIPEYVQFKDWEEESSQFPTNDDTPF